MMPAALYMEPLRVGEPRIDVSYTRSPVIEL
jgi:hypothetical protein